MQEALLLKIFTAATTIITAIFAVHLFIQYRERRKLHQLIWTLAFVLYSVTAFFEFLALYLGTWDVPANYLLYRLYYVFSSPMVALLGVGVLLLLFPKKWGVAFLSYSIVMSAALILTGLTASLHVEAFKELQVAGLAMPSHVRVFSPVMTVPGGLILILGALYSYMKDRTRTFCIPIALGGLFPFVSGILARYGIRGLFYLFEMVGAILLYVGFVWSVRYIKAREVKTRKKPSRR
jgi:hypothetical protein